MNLIPPIRYTPREDSRSALYASPITTCIYERRFYLGEPIHLKISANTCNNGKSAYTSYNILTNERGTMDFSQYRRVLVYVLTFLAYAWSGYGAGLLGNLRDAVLAAESVFQDLFENALTVAKKVKDIHEVFDAAVEEHCVYQCPGGVAPKPDWNHRPQSNGCGSLGIEINQEYLPLAEMTKCCDLHDICYDTCNSDKEKCDLDFKRCLYRYCDGYQSSGMTIVNTCKAAAKMLFTGTTALGCKSYIDAQKEACYCGDKRSKNKRPKKAAQAGGEL